jgi:hypothetical protein
MDTFKRGLQVVIAVFLVGLGLMGVKVMITMVMLGVQMAH